MHSELSETWDFYNTLRGRKFSWNFICVAMCVRAVVCAIATSSDGPAHCRPCPNRMKHATKIHNFATPKIVVYAKWLDVRVDPKIESCVFACKINCFAHFRVRVLFDCFMDPKIFGLTRTAFCMQIIQFWGTTRLIHESSWTDFRVDPKMRCGAFANK